VTAGSSPAPQARRRAGKTLSLVIPMHDEAEVLEVLFQRLDASVAQLGLALEIVCVDDGSRDDTWALMATRAAADPRIRLVGLSRNFGKEAALTAGLDVATGDLVVPLDADLQDPPELIAEFVTLWEQGYDVVYGVRADRSSDSRAKRWSAGAFYRLFNVVAEQAIPASTGDFRLMDRAVVEALKALPERNRFMKGLFAWVGFRQVGVPYVRPERAAGTSSFPYRRSAVFALLAAAVIVIRVLVVGRDVPGYASLMVVILFAFALQMVALGVLGEYIGRMYQEVKGRPIYLVRDRVGFKD
jgi:polyisoprenyl-phosphate glycosyltransferase